MEAMGAMIAMMKGLRRSHQMMDMMMEGMMTMAEVAVVKMTVVEMLLEARNKSQA